MNEKNDTNNQNQNDRKQNSFWSRVTPNLPSVFNIPRPTSNQLKLLLIMSLSKIVSASPFSFSRDGTHYVWDETKVPYSGYKNLASQFFDKIKDSLTNGVCGDIILSNLIPTTKDTVVSDYVCSAEFSLSRDALSAAQEIFENCSIEEIKSAAQLFQDQCDQIGEHEGKMAAIIIGAVFGGLALLTITVAICFACCHRSSQNNQAAAVQPNARVPRKIPVTEQTYLFDDTLENGDMELPTSKRLGGNN